MRLKNYFWGLGIIAMASCNQNEQPVTEEPDMSNNPLIAEWTTPFGTPPFNIIKNKHYEPAFMYALDVNNKEIEAIAANTEAPTFENTIVALELSGSLLTKVSNVFYNLESANTNDSLKEISSKMAPILSEHNDNISLNEALFARIKTVYESPEKASLQGEDLRLMEETYKNFVRAGADVKGEDKTRLKEINSRLAVLSRTFGDNLLAETNNFELHITDEADVAELPAGLVAMAKEEAVNRGHENGWVFTLQRPSINPFLQSSTNRDLRRKMFDGYAMRGNNNNANDNKAVLEEMVNLRIERAHILGFNSHAEYELSNSVAETPAAVYSFMDKLWPSALAMATQERDQLAAAMKKDGINETFEGSDWRYYVEKIRAERYNFNEEETRPYFEFTAVREGCFMLANKLFGLTFKERNDIPKWHKDQQVYEVLEEDGRHLGIIYMDFFIRDSKQGGAWMNEIRSQSNVNGMITPIVTNNFNFPPPTADGPSLLSFSEAETLFHEFGHGLHGLFSNVKYESLSGTRVPRDFVEFPSQVMENWMSEPEVLKLYAKHYKTGEVISDDLINRMNAANRFNSGFATVEYMEAAYLDMAWHVLSEKNTIGTNEFEAAEMARLKAISEIIPRYRSTYFAHIFSGEYMAGYYSYLWSEVLDADAFAAFKETSIFDKETAARYRQMLANGGSKPGMESYVDFRGKEPNVDYLLIKKGFKK